MKEQIVRDLKATFTMVIMVGDSINDLLVDIQEQLRDFGMLMIQFGLDEPDSTLLNESSHVYLLADEIDINAESFFQANRSKLTQDQENIFNTITKHIDEARERIVRK